MSFLFQILIATTVPPSHKIFMVLGGAYTKVFSEVFGKEQGVAVTDF